MTFRSTRTDQCLTCSFCTTRHCDVFSTSIFQRKKWSSKRGRCRLGLTATAVQHDVEPDCVNDDTGGRTQHLTARHGSEHSKRRRTLCEQNKKHIGTRESSRTPTDQRSYGAVWTACCSETKTSRHCSRQRCQ